MDKKPQKKGRKSIRELIMRQENPEQKSAPKQESAQKSAPKQKTAPKMPKKQKPKTLPVSPAKPEPEAFEVIEGKKEQNLKKRRLLSFLIPGVTAILIIAIAIFHFSVPTGMIEWIETGLASSGSGAGFPLALSGGNTVAVSEHGGNMAVLTDSMLTDVNSAGKVLYTRPHNYSNPVIETSVIRTLIYDRSGKEYRIENAKKTVYSAKTDYPVAAGDICDNGDYALVTGADEYAALVTVYNRDGNAKFKWNSTDKIIAVSLSADGKKIAVATIDSEGGAFQSVVYLFDLSKTEPAAKKVLDNALVLSLDWDGGLVEVLTDSQLLKLKFDGTVAEPFDTGGKLICFDKVNGVGTVFNLSIHNNIEENQIVLLSKDGKKKTSFNFSKKVQAVSASHDTIYVLSDHLYAYDFNGKPVKDFEIPSGAMFVKGCKDSALVTYKTEIKSYK